VAERHQFTAYDGATIIAQHARSLHKHSEMISAI
jgi:hypothetical protein